MALIAFVHVADENGTAHVFGPGDSVPEWARKKITNPTVWDGESTKVEVPPQAGPKGGRDKWAAYAAANGVAADAEWKRDDIIEALEARGIPVV
ncbi:hypothetical protein ACFULT_26345 [Rhodococcus sp. NPDC057297]|uniref:hypothetical protein n=1 Tax=Rhodococcus sp. NPDC057297 TaxID=3346090 RepID=UPI003641FBFD